MNGKVYLGFESKTKRLEHHEGQYYRIIALTGLHDTSIVYPVGDGFLPIASLFTFDSVKRKLDGVDPIVAFNNWLDTSLVRMATGNLYCGWVYPVALALDRMDEYEKVFAAYQQIKQTKTQEQQERKRVLEASRMEKQKEHMVLLKSSVKEGKNISGNELLELADVLGLPTHPRTKHAIKRWIKSISPEGVEVDKKHQSVCSSTFKLYNHIQSLLSEE